MVAIPEVGVREPALLGLLEPLSEGRLARQRLRCLSQGMVQYLLSFRNLTRKPHRLHATLRIRNFQLNSVWRQK